MPQRLINEAKGSQVVEGGGGHQFGAGLPWGEAAG